MGELLYTRVRAPTRRQFVLSTSVKLIDKITVGVPPAPGEALKFISLHGGVASLSFIAWVAKTSRSWNCQQARSALVQSSIST